MWYLHSCTTLSGSQCLCLISGYETMIAARAVHGPRSISWPRQVPSPPPWGTPTTWGPWQGNKMTLPTCPQTTRPPSEGTVLLLQDPHGNKDWSKTIIPVIPITPTWPITPTTLFCPHVMGDRISPSQIWWMAGQLFSKQVRFCLSRTCKSIAIVNVW